MRIQPLTGQVLVFVPPVTKTDGGLDLPEDNNAEERQGAQRAFVKEIGPWPKLKNGLAMPPEFRRNSEVLVSKYAGKPVDIGFGPHLKLVGYRDILAVLT